MAMVALACWSPQVALACVWAQDYAWYSNMAILFALNVTKQRYPYNYLLLLALTLSTGTTVASASAYYYYSGSASAVLSAGVLTAVAFVSLSLYAQLSGTDFSWMRGGLYSGLAMLCALYFCQWLGAFAPQLWTAYFGVALFGGFVLYDTDRISKRDGMSLDDYIVGATELYLDIVNIFLHLLRIFGESERKDDGKRRK